MRFTVNRMTTAPIHQGCEIDYTIRWLRVPLRWTTLITAYDRNVRFVDEQKRGPYKRWWHEHRFERISDDETLMTDRIEYELPLGPIGAVAHALAVKRQLRQIMDFRAAAIERLFPPPILIP
jgi:ligand-binding SRPBCC domain-containing protein